MNLDSKVGTHHGAESAPCAFAAVCNFGHTIPLGVQLVAHGDEFFGAICRTEAASLAAFIIEICD